ncbi:response regulator transcription factor [Pseudomonas fluorescens]|uniref:response regulator transcription factor n=1 Tax=Pseudomonas fluorescens TaxID=294 RepID=UPI003338D08A
MSGLSSKEIGRALGISPLTVRKHRRNIFGLLHVRSVAELAGQISTLETDTTPSE